MTNHSPTPPKALSIAGFDGSCGAGLQADLKTFAAHRCYGLAVLTSLPVQNTQGVREIHDIDTKVIWSQLECMFDDVTPDVIKIGMLGRTEVIETVVGFLKERAKNIPVVLDPVMVAKSGHHLLLPEAVKAMREILLPIATILTPNLPEADVLLSRKISNPEEMEKAAKDLLSMGPSAVMMKGGHFQNSKTSDDFFLSQEGVSEWFHASRIPTKNQHGTGCTLSAAIAANLALGQDAKTACQKAKQYLWGALEASDILQMGKGQGSVHHFYELWK